MGLISRSIITLFSIGGLSLASQAPEFAQQYRQRLGGAIDELRMVVADFDRDAAASNLTRRQALQMMVESPTQFFQDRGRSMGITIRRFDSLVQQQHLMERASALVRPLFILQSPDNRVMEGAWRQFEPALPLTLAGLVYGGLGALGFAILAHMGIGSARAMRRRLVMMARGADKVASKPSTVEAASQASAPITMPTQDAKSSRARVSMLESFKTDAQ